MNPMTKLVMLSVLGVTMSGCATNPFHQFYTAAPGAEACQDPKSPCRTNPRFVQNAGPVRIASYSSNPTRDNEEAWNNGWMPIGSASFFGPSNKVHLDDLKEQAKAVGAGLVIYNTQYKDTLNGSSYYAFQNPTQSSSTAAAATGPYSSAAAAASNTSGGGGWAGGGTYHIDRNNTFASFWIAQDAAKQRLGVRSKDLTEDLRTKLQRNTGIVVIGVIHGTPAYAANILKDDVILKIGGEDVLDVATFQKTQLTKFAGQTVKLDCLRNDKPMTFTVTLNASPNGLPTVAGIPK